MIRLHIQRLRMSNGDVHVLDASRQTERGAIVRTGTNGGTVVTLGHWIGMSADGDAPDPTFQARAGSDAVRVYAGTRRSDSARDASIGRWMLADARLVSA